MAETLQAYLDRMMPKIDTGIHEFVHYRPVGEYNHRNQILQEVAAQSKAPHSGTKRMAVGAAGLFNFDVVVAGNYDALVLFDVNMRQAAFWKELIDYIKVCSSARMFCDHYNGPRQASLRRVTNADDVKHLLLDTEWAKSEESYQKIRKLVLNGCIGTVTLDITDVDRCKKLGDALRTYDDGAFKVETIYGSNIWEFMGPNLHQDLSLVLKSILEESVAIARQHPRSETDRASALRRYVLDAFARAHPDNGASETLKGEFADMVIDVLKELVDNTTGKHVLWSPHPAADIAAITASRQLAARISRQLTLSDIDALGLNKPARAGFYPGKLTQPATLDGLRAMGDTDTTIYLCNTASRQPLTKITGGAPRQHTPPGEQGASRA